VGDSRGKSALDVEIKRLPDSEEVLEMMILMRDLTGKSYWDSPYAAVQITAENVTWACKQQLKNVDEYTLKLLVMKFRCLIQLIDEPTEEMKMLHNIVWNI